MEFVGVNDNSNNKAAVSTVSGRFVQFDGLRGLAIIIVVLSHCDILNQGGTANAFFFALSGFLLINPFKEQYERRFLSIWNILKFYKSRAIRILPAYYLVLLIVYIQTRFNLIEKDVFIDLLYFGNIYEHLWFIYAYFWIMLFIPFFFVAFIFLAKHIKSLNNDLVCFFVFIVLSGLIRLFFVCTDLFDIRFDQLLIGFAVGYLYRYLRNNTKFKNSKINKPYIGDLFILLVFLFVIFSSSSVLSLFNPDLEYFYIGWHYIYLVGLIFGLLILMVSLFPGCIAGRILSLNPLRFIGKLSYPIYLMNFFLVKQINVQNKYFQFLCVFSVCVVLSWLIDTAISKVITALQSCTKNKKAVRKS